MYRSVCQVSVCVIQECLTWRMSCCSSVDKTLSWCILAPAGHSSIRVLQWNHLSQTLGTKGDKFVECPPEALSWTVRRWRILEELIRHEPDIICLQEVDHFHTLERALGSIGYLGK